MDSVPTEIWAEIIDHALYDDILFLINPLESTYTFQTALREWNSRHRARRFELQRGILRLVSTTWKELADRSSYQHFDFAYLDDPTNHLERAGRACRIQLNASCRTCGCFWECSCAKCSECFNHMERVHPLEVRTLDKLKGGEIRAEILDVSAWEMEYLLGNTIDGKVISATLLPHLRALTVHGAFRSIVSLALHHSDLVTLTLTLTVNEGGEDPGRVYFRHLAVLRITFGVLARPAQFEGWSLPALQYLETTWSSSSVSTGGPLLSFTLLPTNKEEERRNRSWQYITDNHIYIPLKYLWRFRQDLVYFAVAPLNEVWKKFIEEISDQHASIVEQFGNAHFGVALSLRRRMASANLGKTYGPHSWMEVPIDFVNYDAATFRSHPLLCKEGWNCWICIAELWDWCTKKRLGCEDRDGQSFSGRRRIGA